MDGHNIDHGRHCGDMPVSPLQARELSIAVVIPCYRVKGHVLDVIARVPQTVDRIYCVDDACPDGSGRLIQEQSHDPRVSVLFHEKNRGVGGATKTGYLAARADRCDIAVKIDGDGQMNPELIPAFVRPIVAGRCDYTKGNRFFRIEDVRNMPSIRLVGNAVLSFLSKLSTGYWRLFDPTNGFTAIHLSLLDVLPLEKIAERYFFETDLLFRLNIARCVVHDVPMSSVYADERSNLSIRRVALPFVWGHARNLTKRIFYEYFLRDFHLASVEFILGPLLLLSGAIFGAEHWWLSSMSGTAATPGTVMIPALMIIIGMQLLLAALAFDISNEPDHALYPTLS